LGLRNKKRYWRRQDRLEDGALMLEPDARAYFPDSDLRSLIELMKHLPPAEYKRKKTRPAHQVAE